MRNIIKITLSLVSLALLVAGSLYMIRSTSFAGQNKPSYQLANVQKGDFIWSISATGIVEPKAVTEIRSMASGEIKAIHVEVGMKVKKGQTLLELDPKIEQRRVNQAKADLLIAYANYNKAKSSYLYAQTSNKRLQMLLQKGLISKEEAEKTANTFSLQRAERSLRYAQIRRAKETLKEAQERLKETRIVAPNDGVILQRFVQPGQIISSGTNSASGGTILLRMADLDDLYIRGDVDEADVARIKEGMPVNITADALPQQVFAGNIHRINPEGKNENNVTVFEILVKLGPKATKVMKLNMSTNLKIVVAQHKDVLLVPSMAVRQSRRGARVLVFADGQASRRRVKLGMSNGMQTIIKEGLKAHESIVVSSRGNSKSKRRSRRGKNRKGMSMRNMRRMMR
tara:strand:- start:3790 stop:4986 length:1197 start_codon:yes stop_codon:yes gene_type:complete